MRMTARLIQTGFLSAVMAVLSSFASLALAEADSGQDPQQLVADTIDRLVDRPRSRV